MTSTETTIGGRYRTLRLLGRGGMAEVWEARDEVLQRRVAVKLFGSHDDADARRSAAEMHTLAALDHPWLVTVHDAGTDGDRSYLVMELVDGETLADRLRRGPLDRAEAATLGAQVAAGLAYIHARGIVHRDVKPANLLLPARDHDDAPTVKIVDFGIAQHAGSERLTRTGTTIGTAAYLSPEQVTGKPVTPATDVYALGLVLLEALGRAPGWTGTPIEIAVARLNAPPAVPDDLGRTWAPLLRSMTAADPELRPTAAQVRQTLAATAAGTENIEAPAAVGATTVLPASGHGPSSTRVIPADAGRGGPVPPVRPGPVATEAVPVGPADQGRRRRSRLLLAGLLALGLAAVAVALAVVIGGSPDDTAPAGGTPSSSGATSSAPETTTPSTSEAPTTPASTEAPTTEAPTVAETPTPPSGPGNGGGPGGDKGPGGGPGKPEKTKPGKP